MSRLAELRERVALVVGRVQKVRAQIRAVHEGLLDEGRAATALALFEPVWQGLAAGEQARVLGLLVQREDYDGARHGVDHPSTLPAFQAARPTSWPAERRDAAHDDDIDDRA